MCREKERSCEGGKDAGTRRLGVRVGGCMHARACAASRHAHPDLTVTGAVHLLAPQFRDCVLFSLLLSVSVCPSHAARSSFVDDTERPLQCVSCPFPAAHDTHQMPPVLVQLLPEIGSLRFSLYFPIFLICRAPKRRCRGCAHPAQCYADHTLSSFPRSSRATSSEAQPGRSAATLRLCG